MIVVTFSRTYELQLFHGLPKTFFDKNVENERCDQTESEICIISRRNLFDNTVPKCISTLQKLEIAMLHDVPYGRTSDIRKLSLQMAFPSVFSTYLT